MLLIGSALALAFLTPLDLWHTPEARKFFLVSVPRSCVKPLG